MINTTQHDGEPVNKRTVTTRIQFSSGSGVNTTG